MTASQSEGSHTDLIRLQLFPARDLRIRDDLQYTSNTFSRRVIVVIGILGDYKNRLRLEAWVDATVEE